MINAAGMAMKQNLVTPNAGDITVTPGFALACRHVIHSNCSQWQGGKGEQVTSYFVFVLIDVISNSNWTECGTIQGVIGRFKKLLARLLPELYDTKFNS